MHLLVFTAPQYEVVFSNGFTHVFTVRIYSVLILYMYFNAGWLCKYTDVYDPSRVNKG